MAWKTELKYTGAVSHWSNLSDTSLMSHIIVSEFTANHGLGNETVINNDTRHPLW
jgi:hypothetical protein